jgi:hypothetical protein
LPQSWRCRTFRWDHFSKLFHLEIIEQTGHAAQA